jgi:hypothetical protein
MYVMSAKPEPWTVGGWPHGSRGLTAEQAAELFAKYRRNVNGYLGGLL